MAGRKRNDQIPMADRPCTRRDDQTCIWSACESRYSTLTLRGIGHIDWGYFYPKGWCQRLNNCKLACSAALQGIPKDRRPLYAGRNLMKQLEPFPAKAVV